MHHGSHALGTTAGISGHEAPAPKTAKQQARSQTACCSCEADSFTSQDASLVFWRFLSFGERLRSMQTVVEER